MPSQTKQFYLNRTASCCGAVREKKQMLKKPKYVSAELGPFELALKAVDLGYRRFKLVNQDSNRFTKLPNPPLEGQFCEATFSGLMSGLFGEEAPGSWMPFEEFQQLIFTLNDVPGKHPHLFPNDLLDFHASF